MPIPSMPDLFLPVPRNEPQKEEKNKKGVYYQILDVNKEEATALHEISFLMQILSSQKNVMNSPVLISLAEFLDKNVFNSTFTKSEKLSRDIVKEEHRNIVKKKWYEKTLGYFHKLATATGDFWKQLMMGILALAIFDPKGKILKMVINFLVKAITWVINAIANNLPMILQNAIFITTKVIPDVLRKLIDGVFDALSGMFDKWAKDLPEGSTLKLLFDGLKDLFGKDSVIRDFLKWIAGLFPIFIAVVGVIKLVILLQTIYTTATAFFGAVLSLITSPITLTIIAITAIIVLLWKFRDEIAGVFESVFDWFMNLGVVAKIVIGTIAGALAILFWPVTLVIGAIYGLVKLFQLLSTATGRKKVLDFLKYLGKTLMKFFIGLFSGIGKVLKTLVTKGFGAAIGSLLDGIVNWIAGILPESWGKSFLELWDSLKQTFDDLINWFVTIFRVGPLKFFKMNDEERTKAKDFVRLQRQIETAREDDIKIPEKIAEIEREGNQNFDAALNKFMNSSKDKDKAYIKTVESFRETIIRRDETKQKASPKNIDRHIDPARGVK